MAKAQEAALRRANEIDEFIRDNSDISAEDYGSAYEACVTLVERERKKVIEKAWEWLSKNINNLATPSPYGIVVMLDRFEIYKEKFKQAMEG